MLELLGAGAEAAPADRRVAGVADVVPHRSPVHAHENDVFLKPVPAVFIPGKAFEKRPVRGKHLLVRGGGLTQLVERDEPDAI